MIIQQIEIRYKQIDQESQSNFQKYFQQSQCIILDSIHYNHLSSSNSTPPIIYTFRLRLFLYFGIALIFIRSTNLHLFVRRTTISLSLPLPILISSVRLRIANRFTSRQYPQRTYTLDERNARRTRKKLMNHRFISFKDNLFIPNKSYQLERLVFFLLASHKSKSTQYSKKSKCCQSCIVFCTSIWQFAFSFSFCSLCFSYWLCWSCWYLRFS